MKKHTPKINPDLKIREYIDDAKMTAAQIVHDIEALNQRFSMSSPKDLFVPQKSQDIQALVDICFYEKQMRIPKFFLDELWKKTSFSMYQEDKKQMLDQAKNMGMF